MALMMYVVQRNSADGGAQWLGRTQPTLIWGDKRNAMMFETRALARMAAQIAAKVEAALEIVFIPDPLRWQE